MKYLIEIYDEDEIVGEVAEIEIRGDENLANTIYEDMVELFNRDGQRITLYEKHTELKKLSQKIR